MPDMDTGRIRHLGESLDQFPVERDRFWDLLRAEDVVAYICGHTHNFSAAFIRGVWQVDGGHSRGMGDPEAPSTALIFDIQPEIIRLEALRETYSGGPYALKHTFLLQGGERAYLPLVNR
jgi:predicted phosphodiesterase